MTRDERGEPDARDDIEQALAEELDAAHLSIYGDYLQAIGDPRGRAARGGDDRLMVTPAR